MGIGNVGAVGVPPTIKVRHCMYSQLLAAVDVDIAAFQIVNNVDYSH